MPPACPEDGYAHCYNGTISNPPPFPSDGEAVAGERGKGEGGAAVCSGDREVPPGKPGASNEPDRKISFITRQAPKPFGASSSSVGSRTDPFTLSRHLRRADRGWGRRRNRYSLLGRPLTVWVAPLIASTVTT